VFDEVMMRTGREGTSGLWRAARGTGVHRFLPEVQN
jgi:hypothetical protein